ncbi:hypothetical protein LSAT2_002531 [Lamellibrachia satsuma]|nr:hypothetical protein LSAT2_002531 [Lamellibrachia satsuma]
MLIDMNTCVYKRKRGKCSSPTVQVKVFCRLKQDCVSTVNMSKLLAALVVLSVACAVQGCGLDTCNGRPNGVSFPSLCGPCHYYYVCIRRVIVYRWCSRSNQCIINGRCRRCGDSCEGKPDGRYPSVNRARPYYYTCEAGQLFYQECQPTQVYNPWTRKCEVTVGVYCAVVDLRCDTVAAPNPAHTSAAAHTNAFPAVTCTSITVAVAATRAFTMPAERKRETHRLDNMKYSEDSLRQDDIIPSHLNSSIHPKCLCTLAVGTGDEGDVILRIAGSGFPGLPPLLCCSGPVGLAYLGAFVHGGTQY